MQAQFDLFWVAAQVSMPFVIAGICLGAMATRARHGPTNGLMRARARQTSRVPAGRAFRRLAPHEELQVDESLAARAMTAAASTPSGGSGSWRSAISRSSSSVEPSAASQTIGPTPVKHHTLPGISTSSSRR